MIRRAVPEDVDAIAALYERSFATLTFLPVLHTLDEHRAWFAHVVADQDVWVWQEADAILGFAALGDGMLNYLYLEPAAFGRGIGSALLEQVKARRPEGFSFWVFQQNARARRFYESRGCTVVELTDGSGNEERTPDALYQWRPASPESSGR
jgi:GNAT superfamily N-acetyltransferase